jgi:hypothetical protein
LRNGPPDRARQVGGVRRQTVHVRKRSGYGQRELRPGPEAGVRRQRMVDVHTGARLPRLGMMGEKPPREFGASGIGPCRMRSASVGPSTSWSIAPHAAFPAHDKAV